MKICTILHAKFSKTLPEQIENFSQQGYILIRRSKSTSSEDFIQLNTNILDYFETIRSSYKYKCWRFFNSVSTSKNRHSIPLPYTVAFRSDILYSSLGHIRPFLNTILNSHDPLVEASGILSLPGKALI